MSRKKMTRMLLSHTIEPKSCTQKCYFSSFFEEKVAFFYLFDKKSFFLFVFREKSYTFAKV